VLINGYRGGEEVLLDVGGQDSTEAFEDVGHSDEAREILEGLLVGTLKRSVLQPFSTSSNTFPHTQLCLEALAATCQISAEEVEILGTVPLRHGEEHLAVIPRNQC
jgi:cytochrome b involved in lipid metabolism